jgi:putative FmdB family regulatory protein
MPLREFDCRRCGRTTEEIFRLSEDVPGRVECEHCGGQAVFREVSRSNIHTLGHHEAEAYNRVFFGAKERANPGFRGVTSRKDVEAMEEHLGLGRRLEPGTAEYVAALEHQQDEAAEVARVQAEGGDEAVLDWELKKSVQEETGWSDSDYVRWEQETEAAMDAVDRGAIPLPTREDSSDACSP